MTEICGCCKGIEVKTPIEIFNRPGLNGLAYRIGTYASFMESMKARLSDHVISVPWITDDNGEPKAVDVSPLKYLMMREDDPSIAFMDAWATVADVLTFYQERIANEGYLRTATERLSILELARLVGYRLRPGVSATAYLAYTIDDDKAAEIPLNARSQSLPEPGEMPQSFETSEVLQAMGEWNSLKPRMTRPQYIDICNAETVDVLYFKGISTNLNPNDPLLFEFSNNQQNQQVIRWVKEVTPDPKTNTTKVDLLVYLTPAAIINAIARTVNMYLDLESYCVSPDNEIAIRVIEFLQEIKVVIDECNTSDKSDTMCHDELIEIIKNFDEKIPSDVGQNPLIKFWISSLKTDLEGYLPTVSWSSSIAMLAGEGIRRGVRISAARNLEAYNEVSTIIAGLDAARVPLMKKRSIQPRSSRYINLHARELYAPQAEIGTRMLKIMYPRLVDTLDRALSNARVTAPSNLISVNAFRAKARPFGNNAPQKPIYNDKGAIRGYDEWQLALKGIKNIRIDLIFNRKPLSSTAGVTYDDSLDVFFKEIEIQGELGASFKFGKNDELNLEIKAYVDNSLSNYFSEFHFSGPINLDLKIEGYNSMKTDFYFNTENFTLKVGNTHIISKSAERIVTSVKTYDNISIFYGIPLKPGEYIQNILTLDAPYEKITPGSWVLIDRPNSNPGHEIRRFKAQEARTVSEANYGITASATQLSLKPMESGKNWLESDDLTISVLRGSTVYAQSEMLELADEPIDPELEPVCGDVIELDRLYTGLDPGRRLIVSGERLDVTGTTGVRDGELVMLAGVTQDVMKVNSFIPIAEKERCKQEVDKQNNSVQIGLPGDKTHTFIKLAKKLAYVYKRDTVTIYGNVVKATHGETRNNEVLGSGDASKSIQRLALHQSPLTYVAANTPSGAKSTLQVRVNDVLWHEVDTMAGLRPNDRNYVIFTDDEDRTTVVFGDGKQGLRPPTGVENIRGVYRTGIGKGGNVKAEKISQMMTRPLNAKSVINPMRASGGADRENLHRARKNTPLALMALDRLVSVQDYSDFTRTFAGIEKASAVRISDGNKQLIHITIAGADDIPIDEDSDLYRNLLSALIDYGDPDQPVTVELRDLMLLLLKAEVKVLPDYKWDFVEPKIREALLDAFGFEKRELGQDVYLSEVLSVMQNVEGVGYVDVNILDSISEKTSTDNIMNIYESKLKSNQPRQYIKANLAMPPTSINAEISPAQLAIFSPDAPRTLDLTEAKNL